MSSWTLLNKKSILKYFNLTQAFAIILDIQIIINYLFEKVLYSTIYSIRILIKKDFGSNLNNIRGVLYEEKDTI